LLLPYPLLAALLYHFEGPVTGVNPQLASLGVAPADTWQLTVAFDENEPDTLPGLSTQGKYLNGSGSLTVNSHTWASTPTSSFQMQVGNESSAPPFAGPPQDWIFLSIVSPTGPTVNGLVPRSLRVELQSSAGFLNEQPLDSIDLPRSLDISKWRFLGMELTYWSGSGTPSTTDPSFSGDISAMSVSGSAVVPLPASLPLLSGGLLLLAAWSRKWR
jgi:hypothetical protein